MGKDWLKSDQREFFRVSVGRLKSVIRNKAGVFEVVEKSIKPLDTSIELKDVSTVKNIVNSLMVFIFMFYW